MHLYKKTIVQHFHFNFKPFIFNANKTKTFSCPSRNLELCTFHRLTAPNGMD